MRVRNIIILLTVLAVLAGIYFVVSRPEPEESTPPKVHVWDINADDIQRIEISLPRQGLSQAFIKIPQGDQFPWYFDDEQKSPINQDRWGVQFILSGPTADRVIKENATDEELAEYGLAQPSIKVTLTLFNEDTLEIDVGDKTLDGINCYVRAPGTNEVALVDYTWYDVLSNLVLDPPYVPAEE